MASEFRKLIAYQQAAELADDLYRVVAAWRSFERWTLGTQIIRSADSIGANVAEASGRWNRPDQRRFLLIARGSLYETEHWLLRAEARGMITADFGERLDRVARALNGLIRKWGPA